MSLPPLYLGQRNLTLAAIIPLAVAQSIYSAADSFLGSRSDTTTNNRYNTADLITIDHIFSNKQHNLDPVVEQFGSEEAAFKALRSATQKAVDNNNITGVFEIIINIDGINVTVRGIVIDGLVRIGTDFIPPGG